MSYALTRATLVEVDDSGSQQLLRLKGLHGEEFSKVYRFQPHGFSSVPAVGSEGVLLRMGETERMLALGFEAKTLRPKGNSAESTHVYGKKVVIEADEIEIRGKVSVTGPELKHNGKNVGDDHHHKDSMPGSGLTGVPNG